MRSEGELRDLMQRLENRNAAQRGPAAVGEEPDVASIQVSLKTQIELLAWVLEDEPPTDLPMYRGEEA